MKTPLQGFLLLLLAMSGIASAAEPGERVIVVPIEKAPPVVPLFFSAAAEVVARVGLETVTSEQWITYRIHQGTPEVLTLALGGAGELVSVSGDGLRDWSLRMADDGSRFLDVRPLIAEGEPVTSLRLLVETRLEIENGTASLLLPGVGPANGLSLAVTLIENSGADLRVVKADGLAPLEAAAGQRFLGHGEGMGCST